MSFDLKLINGDLAIVNGDLQVVRDTELLVQAILKICLTQVGANPMQPGYGSYLSRSVIGNAMNISAITTIAKSQLSTCLTNLQQYQQTQIKSRQRVSASEQLAAVSSLSVTQNAIDPRLFDVVIKALSKGLTPVTAKFSITTI